MGKVGILILGLVIGLIIGGGGILYFIAPHSSAAPIGVPIQAPDPNQPATGTAAIELREDFFAPVIQAILSNGNAPSFPLNFTGTNATPVNERPLRSLLFFNSPTDILKLFQSMFINLRIHQKYKTKM